MPIDDWIIWYLNDTEKNLIETLLPVSKFFANDWVSKFQFFVRDLNPWTHISFILN